MPEATRCLPTAGHTTQPATTSTGSQTGTLTSTRHRLWQRSEQLLLRRPCGAGCGSEGAFAQAGPSGDEAVEGIGLGGPALVVGLLVQQVGELTCPVAVAAEGVKQIGGLALGAPQGSDEVLQRLPDREPVVFGW